MLPGLFRICSCALFGGQLMFSQLTVQPQTPLYFQQQLDSLAPTTKYFYIGAPAGVSYVLDHFEPAFNAPPNFLVIFPKSGTGSGVPGFVGINSEVVRHMQPGNYSVRAVYKTTDPNNPLTATLTVFLLLTVNRIPQIQSVANSTSIRNVLSPGALVSILGSNLGMAGDQSLDSFGAYPTSAEGTTVTFNGVPAALTKVTQERIEAQVPYEMAGQSSADVVVTRYNPYLSSNTVTIPIQDTAPALFTVDQSGDGHALIYRLGVPGVLITPDNQTFVGDSISFQISGVGRYASAIQGLGSFDTTGLQLDGQVVLNQFNLIYPNFVATTPPRPAIPLTVSIGGVNARIIEIRAIPYRLWDVLQVVAVIPSGVAPGAQPMVVRIGNNDNSAQSVTVSIQ